jgi:hypothetical protein
VKGAQIRAAIFWAIAGFVAICTVALDLGSGFVYLPRSFMGAFAAMLLLPLVYYSKLPHRAAAVVVLAALPYALAPVRWNLLKSFYVDCESLRAGMPLAEAFEAMSQYRGDIPYGMETAIMAGVPETTEERDSRIVVVPSDELAMDWCVLYPSGDRLARVEIHPD